MRDRPGIPGESRPTITLAGPGFTHATAKWSNDEHPDFDALAGWLYAVGAHLERSTPPLWTGPFDWHWRPA